MNIKEIGHYILKCLRQRFKWSLILIWVSKDMYELIGKDKGRDFKFGERIQKYVLDYETHGGDIENLDYHICDRSI